MEVWKYKLIIFIILLSSFIISNLIPYFADEALYSIAIKDNINLGLQSTATYFGESMYWKPSLMFNVYAILTKPFYNIIPESILFRSISFLFVILSVFILFKFLKREFNNEKKAYTHIIFILIMPAFFVFSTKLITDTLTFFLICASLYLVQNIERRGFKLLLLLSLIGVGLSKSILFILATIVFVLVYRFNKNKKIEWEIILIGVLSLILFLAYSSLLNINDLHKGDMGRTYLNFNVEEIGKNFLKIFLSMGLTAVTLVKPKKEYILIYLLLIGILLYFILIPLYLFWYIFPILPLVALILNTDVDEKILVTFSFVNLFALILFVQMCNYDGYYNNMMKDIEDYEESIFIGRLGEVIANRMYDYEGVVVTPENSFLFDLKFNKLEEYYGCSEKMTKENILGLIYDYDNPKWHPYFLKDLEGKDKYFPPVTRTEKKFEGEFKQIIIEDKYFIRIEDEILNDYYVYKEVENMYILKRIE